MARLPVRIALRFAAGHRENNHEHPASLIRYNNCEQETVGTSESPGRRRQSVCSENLGTIRLFLIHRPFLNREVHVLQPKIASEIMVTKLVTLPPEMHVSDGIAKLLKHNITGAPVVDADRKFLGVFSEKCSMNVLGVLARSVREEKGAEVSMKASEFMVKKLVTLSPKSDVFDAIGLLLKNRISGAPVLDENGNFLGIFSEKNSMQVLISSAYEQLPTTHVEAFMNRDRDRVISADTDLFDVAQKFADTPLRRLEVVEDGKLLGQISRRDVLKTEQKFSKGAWHRVKTLASQITENKDTGDSSAAAPTVSYFMDRDAKTISEETDFLGVARIFLDTPYRRLPVLKNDRLSGQISRRDILNATNELMAVTRPREKSLLYLSSLVGRQESPFE